MSTLVVILFLMHTYYRVSIPIFFHGETQKIEYVIKRGNH